MAKKVSDLNIGVSLNTDQAQRDSRGLEKDIRGLERELARADNTTRKYENQTRELARMYKAGEVTARQFEQQQAKIDNRMIRSARSMARMTKEAEKFRKEQSRLGKLKGFLGGGLGRGATAALAGGAAIGFAAERMVASFQESYAEALREAGTAEMLGVLPKELASMKFALSQLTGIDSDSIADSLLDITERLGEIADDKGGALGKAGDAIGLNAESLIGLNTSQQLAGIMKALGRIADEETRLFRSRELFGDTAARLLTTAVKDEKEFLRLQKEASKLNLTMTEQQIEIARKANLEFEKAAIEIKGAFRDVTVAIAPLLAGASETVRNANRFYRNDTGNYISDGASAAWLWLENNMPRISPNNNLFSAGSTGVSPNSSYLSMSNELDRAGVANLDKYATRQIAEFGKEIQKLNNAGAGIGKRMSVFTEYFDQFKASDYDTKFAILGYMQNRALDEELIRMMDKYAEGDLKTVEMYQQTKHPVSPLGNYSSGEFVGPMPEGKYNMTRLEAKIDAIYGDDTQMRIFEMRDRIEKAAKSVERLGMEQIEFAVRNEKDLITAENEAKYLADIRAVNDSIKALKESEENRKVSSLESAKNSLPGNMRQNSVEEWVYLKEQRDQREREVRESQQRQQLHNEAMAEQQRQAAAINTLNDTLSASLESL